jgi:hypothetical protein
MPSSGTKQYEGVVHLRHQRGRDLSLDDFKHPLNEQKQHKLCDVSREFKAMHQVLLAIPEVRPTMS